MTVKFSNSGKALITSTVYTHSQTVDVDDASVFPSIVDYGNDYFYVTFQNPSTGNSEICKVTDVIGNKLFIERAQDGTTAGSFGVGDKCENRLNAGALIEAVNDFDITSQTDPKYLRSNTDDTTTHVLTSHSDAKWPLVIGKFVGGSHNQKIKLQGSASPNIDFCSEQHERMMFGYSSFGYGQWYVHDGDNNSARLKLDEDGTLKLTATVSADGVTSETYSDATVFHSGLFTNNATDWDTAYSWGDHADAGYLTSHQSISGKLDKSGGTVTGGLTINTSNPNLIIQNDSGNGAGIKFKDIGDDTQYGNIEYFHQDSKSYGSGEAFVVRGDEPQMSFVVKGKVMYEDGLWVPGTADNSTAAVRKDANWDTAHGWGDHASAGYLTSHQDISGKLDKSGGTITGNLVVEDSEVHVGDVSGDQWTRIKHAAVDGYGFEFEHDNATVIVNEQGSTNQALVLGDVDATNTSAGLFGVSHSTDTGTSWTKKLDLRGDGDLYVGASAQNKVWHEGSLTPTNKSNYDTAHGWGDHSAAGYLTAETHAAAGYLTSETHADAGYLTSETHADAGYLTAVPSKASPATAAELGNVDLDDYAQPADAGFYHQNANVDADIEDNWPNGRAGSLLVQKSANSGNFGATQLFIDYALSDVYVRSMYSDTSPDKAWKRLYTTSDFTNNSSNWNTAHGWGDHASAGYLTNHDPAVLVGVGISSDLDANAYRAGMYGWSTTTVGRPDDNYGQLLSIVSNGNTHNDSTNWITQLAFGTGADTAHFRGKTNDGAWGGWKTFFHSDNFTDNSSNWNTAHGWGDHSAAGYLTSHQSLSAYATTASLNASNWDTAYGWGDHSAAGYAASSHGHEGLKGTWSTIDLNAVAGSDYSFQWDHYSQASFNKPGASTPDNANGVITANTHSSNYRHQIAFHSDEQFYHRAQQSGTWGDWNKVLHDSKTTQTSNITIRNSSPTLYLRDTDHNSAMLHTNSDVFYVLRGSDDTTTWAQVNNKWPMEINLTTNNATFGGNVTAYSDASLKENVSPIGNSMEMFNQIEAKRFDWIVDGKHDIGFIAQDVQAAGLTEVVIQKDERDPDTGELLDTKLTLDYSRMVSVLWDVVKDLKEEVDDLKAKLEDKD
jgi:hypothetical protein